ncbi:hypothetical protein [Tranquillimonas alkanivorans]|uniref:Uncharacterized protein n=1 Tax=Tranquillimonas alkanivorans TaxID=441119 RepID=A0A1I5MB12_9RHOB|nr:hypothetical protein [Tranquillimonas alkanivorans]SFP06745.1 hypothetical protein SAMN04488047_102186 [Tranquillimonas alkanivorans]
MPIFPTSLCAAYVAVLSLLVMIWSVAGLLPVVAVAAAAELVVRYVEINRQRLRVTVRDHNDER